MFTIIAAFILMFVVLMLFSGEQGAGLGGAYKTYSCEPCNESGRQRPPTITEPMNYVPKCRICGKLMKESADR